LQLGHRHIYICPNHYNRINMKQFLVIAAIGLTVIYFAACNNNNDTTTTPPPTASFAGAYNAPAVRTFPSPSKKIYEWINSMDDAQIRAHGWDIWESINTIMPGDTMPIWEHWFTGYELYQAPTDLATRETIRDFERPEQFFHAAVFKKNKGGGHNQEAISFNRFSPSLAQVIYSKGYNTQKVLNDINNGFTKNNTPPVDRQIQTSKDTVDVQSFALKPVFQFISGTGPTAIPYWAGVSTQTTTSLTNPSPDTWRQCVVVDPTGKLKPGTKYKIACNGEPAQEWPVVSLNDFYHLTITQAMADSFSNFAVTSGDEVGQNNQTDSASVAAMVKAGNIALLMAMHVTGKEINNWTWQTFWWSPNPQDALYGKDRPTSIKAPWNHYNMNTAYYMVSPPGTLQGGEPLVAFNPYLETNLIGKVSTYNGTADSVTWYGVFSNCMSCHRMAAWQNSTYIPNGNIDPSDSLLFSNNTKTDFLWSIPTRAR
jgi:hypothetical protein